MMKNQLVEQIEKQLGWGNGASWSNKDFQELSELIFKTTHQQVSVTTLKRVWGRAELIANPSMATLDILAQFAGYESWRNFCQLHASKPTENNKTQEISRPKTWNWVIIIIVIVALSSLAWYAIDSDAIKSNNPLPVNALDDIKFTLQKVSSGYPNTVIFQYDIGDMPFDSLCIQQSWDNSKQIPLTKPQGLVTTTYYSPGYFLAKLLVNGQIVKEKDLYIPTDGWQGLILGNQEKFIYLKPGQLKKDSLLTITPDVLQDMNQSPDALLYLANLSDHPQINSSNFSLETEFRLLQPTEKSICHNIRLFITGTKDVCFFQFSIPGCVGDLMFYVNREMISGKDHDLSAFGLDFNKWVNCKINVKDNQLWVLLNNNKVFNYPLTSDIGNIGGVQWIFEGLGEIRSLQLDDGENSMDLMQ